MRLTEAQMDEVIYNNGMSDPVIEERIEAARLLGAREERERIIERVERYAMYFQGRISGQGNLYILAEDWQALKEGK